MSFGNFQFKAPTSGGGGTGFGTLGKGGFGAVGGFGNKPGFSLPGAGGQAGQASGTPAFASGFGAKPNPTNATPAAPAPAAPSVAPTNPAPAPSSGMPTTPAPAATQNPTATSTPATGAPPPTPAKPAIATPAATTSNEPRFQPPVTTIGTQYTPGKVSHQDKQYNYCNILGMDQFSNVGRDEVRAYDYFSNQLIDNLPTPPEPSKTAAAGATGSGLFGQKTGLNSTLGQNTENKAGTGLFQTTQQTSQGVTPQDIDYKQAEYPFQQPYTVQTAAQYFLPNAHRIKSSSRIDASQSGIFAQETENYSFLFEPRKGAQKTSLSKSVATPITITADLLRCAYPVDSSIHQFTQMSTQSNENRSFKTIPPLNQAMGMKGVSNFRIFKEETITIDFQGKVDLTEFNFDKDIAIGCGFLDIYRYKRSIPPEGTGLNQKAIITFNNIWPKDPSTGTRKYTKNLRILKQFEEDLKKFCTLKNANFAFYLPDRGIFQFIVHNFNHGPIELP